LIRGWNPVRNGEPLFADKDMRKQWNLRRFPFSWDHRSDPHLNGKRCRGGRVRHIPVEDPEYGLIAGQVGRRKPAAAMDRPGAIGLPAGHRRAPCNSAVGPS
jgi:hypothetical protein